MALVVLDQGSLILLNQLISNLFNVELTLCLFQNDHTPTEGDDNSDYVEADFDGYLAVGVDSWTPPYLNGANKAETDEINRTFTQTGTGVTNDIYGYYVKNSAGDIIWAERDPSAPVAMDAIGKTYTVFLRFTVNSE